MMRLSRNGATRRPAGGEFGSRFIRQIIDSWHVATTTDYCHSLSCSAWSSWCGANSTRTIEKRGTERESERDREKDMIFFQLPLPIEKHRGGNFPKSPVVNVCCWRGAIEYESCC